MDDYQQDVGAALAEAVERSWTASKTTLKLRVWHVMREAGYDLPRLEQSIADEIAFERRKKGRQQPGPYNRPPKELEKKFEAIARHIEGKPTQKGGPAMVRYELQGPIQKHGKSDLTQDELEAIGRFIQNGLRATRGPKLIADLNAAGGGSAKSGGVRDSDRLAYTTHQLTLSRLPATFHPILNGLIEGGVTTLSIGQWLLPTVSTEASLRAAGRAFLKTLAMQLHDFEMNDNGLDRGPNQKTLRAQAIRERNWRKP